MAETRGDICQSQAVIERMENVSRSELGRDVWPVYGSDTTDFSRAWQLKTVVLVSDNGSFGSGSY